MESGGVRFPTSRLITSSTIRRGGNVLTGPSTAPTLNFSFSRLSHYQAWIGGGGGVCVCLTSLPLSRVARHRLVHEATYPSVKTTKFFLVLSPVFSVILVVSMLACQVAVYVPPVCDWGFLPFCPPLCGLVLPKGFCLSVAVRKQGRGKRQQKEGRRERDKRTVAGWVAAEGKKWEVIGVCIIIKQCSVVHNNSLCLKGYLHAVKK